MKVKHSVSSPPKVWGTFFLKKIYIGEQTFLDKFRGVVLHGDNDQIMRWGKGKFHKCIFQLSEHYKSENFPGHSGRHLNINPNQNKELWKDLTLRLLVKRFQSSSQVQFPSCWPWPEVLLY